MEAFNLQAKITLDSSEYEKGLNQAKGMATSFGSKLKGGLVTAKVGTVVIGAPLSQLLLLSKALLTQGLPLTAVCRRLPQRWEQRQTKFKT